MAALHQYLVPTAVSRPRAVQYAPGRAAEGIAPLVLALEGLPVIVVDGAEGEGEAPARIRFVHRGSPHVAALFAADLASLLAARDEVAGYTLSTVWRPSVGEPVFQLACLPSQTPALASAISELSAVLSGMS